MPKFHDEFFKKGSRREDDIVSFMIDNFDSIFKENIFPQIFSKVTEDIFICGSILKNKFCKRTNQAQNYRPFCVKEKSINEYTHCQYLDLDGHTFEEWLKTLLDDIESHPSFIEYHTAISFSRYDCDDKLIRLEKDNDTTWQIILRDSRARVPVFKEFRPEYSLEKYPLKYTLNSYNVQNSETEKICKTGNGFIIGYADIVYDMIVNITGDIVLSPSWIWKKYCTPQKEILMVFECKPTVGNFMAPLRQIKTYMDILERTHNWEGGRKDRMVVGVIVTYDKIEEKFTRIMRKEKVYVVTLEEKKVKGSSFQQQLNM